MARSSNPEEKLVSDDITGFKEGKAQKRCVRVYVYVRGFSIVDLYGKCKVLFL